MVVETGDVIKDKMSEGVVAPPVHHMSNYLPDRQQYKQHR